MLKKLKSSLVFICLISLLTGCVNQNQEVTSDQEITVAATSIAVTEILDQLNIPAKQVVGIPQSDSYTVPKKYQKTTKIGNAMTPDMEKISTLKPDLILHDIRTYRLHLPTIAQLYGCHLKTQPVKEEAEILLYKKSRLSAFLRTACCYFT